MSDDWLRRAERTYRAAEDVEAGAALLKARLRAGELDTDQIGLAALCGDPAACALQPTPKASFSEWAREVQARGGREWLGEANAVLALQVVQSQWPHETEPRAALAARLRNEPFETAPPPLDEEVNPLPREEAARLSWAALVEDDPLTSTVDAVYRTLIWRDGAWLGGDERTTARTRAEAALRTQASTWILRELLAPDDARTRRAQLLERLTSSHSWPQLRLAGYLGDDACSELTGCEARTDSLRDWVAGLAAWGREVLVRAGLIAAGMLPVGLEGPPELDEQLRAGLVAWLDDPSDGARRTLLELDERIADEGGASRGLTRLAALALSLRAEQQLRYAQGVVTWVAIAHWLSEEENLAGDALRRAGSTLERALRTDETPSSLSARGLSPADVLAQAGLQGAIRQGLLAWIELPRG